MTPTKNLRRRILSQSLKTKLLLIWVKAWLIAIWWGMDLFMEIAKLKASQNNHQRTNCMSSKECTTNNYLIVSRARTVTWLTTSWIFCWHHKILMIHRLQVWQNSSTSTKFNHFKVWCLISKISIKKNSNSNQTMMISQL